MSAYLCWDDDNQSEEDARIVEAATVGEAAETFAETEHGDEPFDLIDVQVKDLTENKEFVVRVLAEISIDFRAEAPRAIDKKEET